MQTQKYKSISTQSDQKLRVYGLLLLLAVTMIPTVAHALVITDNLQFESSNQSMWSEGGTAEWSVETFVGTKWGTYAGEAAVNKSIGLDVGAASVRGGIKSSGEIGIVPWAKASGGNIDISLPTQASITFPDSVSANTYFKVSTSSSIQSSANIVASAPNFKAGVDGLINMDNRLYGKAATFAGCGTFGVESCTWSGGVDVDLFAGRFSLLGFDTTEDDPLSIFGVNLPLISFDHKYLIHVPAGPAYPFIYDADTGTTTPPFTPVIGDIIIHNLEEKSGGLIDGDQLSLSSYQGIFEAKLSITGVLETLLGSPGVLQNEITVYENSIKDIKAGYTLADVSTGPILGMQQDFNLDPNLAVRLEFDKPVTRLERTQVGSHKETRDIYLEVCFPIVGCISIPNGTETVIVPDYDWIPVTYSNGMIEILLGDEADLMFGDGFANLLGMDYFLNAPEFSNHTYASIDPALQIQSLCARFTGLGQKCVYDETFQTQGLVAMDVYSNDWVMGGFNSVRFDRFGFGPQETIPEPATLLLLLPGLWLFGQFRKKGRIQIRL